MEATNEIQDERTVYAVTANIDELENLITQLHTAIENINAFKFKYDVKVINSNPLAGEHREAANPADPNNERIEIRKPQPYETPYFLSDRLKRRLNLP